VRRDAIYYQIFQRFPSLLFTLLEHPPEQARGYRFESVEVKEPTFRIDGVFLPPEDASPKIVYFAEYQFQKDELLYYRFFTESQQYLYRNAPLYDNWFGVVIFSSRSLEPENTTIHRSLLNGDQVQRIYLDELGNQDEQPIGVSLLQLTISPETETAAQARQLIERAEQEDTGILARNEIIEVITTIAVYKLADLSREEVESMLGLKLEESRIYQEIKEEGREESTRQDTEGLLEAKFGALDSELLSIVAPLVQLSPIERSRLVLQLSREELLARFS
jgi:predicted transposase/invertase (TIGR01784 family)